MVKQILGIAVDAGKKWVLGDAEARAREFPYTFWRPSAALIDQLAVGNVVKLMFELLEPVGDDPGAERMWVAITGIEDGVFRGALDNQPQYVKGLAPGDTVMFEAKHIIDADIDDPVPDPTLKWQPRCLAPDRVIYGNEKVEFLYREAPDNETDSGWRFMCRDEGDDASADEISAVSLGAVLSKDDRMIDLLDREAPVAFEWDEQSGQFIEVEPPKEAV